jgi:hypothetical protein
MAEQSANVCRGFISPDIEEHKAVTAVAQFRRAEVRIACKKRRLAQPVEQRKNVFILNAASAGLIYDPTEVYFPVG